MVLAKWTKMQTAAKVNVAADSAQREAKFRKGLRREATNLQHNMDADQFKQFYTQQALDRRCELRASRLAFHTCGVDPRHPVRPAAARAPLDNGVLRSTEVERRRPLPPHL